MEVSLSLVANDQTPILMDPGDRPLDDPAIASQPFIRLDPLARDPDLDVPLAQEPSAAGDVVRLVGMDLGRPPSATAGWGADRGDRVEHGLEQDAVMPVGPAQARGEGYPMLIDRDMVFGAGFAPVDGVRSGFGAPFWAGTLALSTLTRSQAIRFARPS